MEEDFRSTYAAVDIACTCGKRCVAQGTAYSVALALKAFREIHSNFQRQPRELSYGEKYVENFERQLAAFKG